jgi:hypothetical protein
VILGLLIPGVKATINYAIKWRQIVAFEKGSKGPIINADL